MKPYNELTRRGKLRRQRQLALKALEHYDLDVKDFRLLAAGINTIYRIDTQGGEKYAMRILIHGDLHYWNVHIYRGELYINDFEDIMLGYPVQDIAVTLSYGRTRDDYSGLREAFQKGYTSIRTWPEASTRQLETLITARNINFY